MYKRYVYHRDGVVLMVSILQKETELEEVVLEFDEKPTQEQIIEKFHELRGE